MMYKVCHTHESIKHKCYRKSTRDIGLLVIYTYYKYTPRPETDTALIFFKLDAYSILQNV